MPILLVWGESERILPPSHLDYYRRHMPTGTRFERPAEVGHCPHVDAPITTAARIVRFLRDEL
jgi:pimeloyl-ACP methyl ester carboxylesterase